MAYPALCRILEARTAIRGIAFYEWADGRFVRHYATPEFLALANGPVTAPDWAPAGPGLQKPSPGKLGLRAPHCLVQPIDSDEEGAKGLIVVVLARPPLMEAGIAEALRDVADVAAHLPRTTWRGGDDRPHGQAAELDRSRRELCRALHGGELSLVYQPYVDLATGETSGVEALMRWQHPTRGEISPAQFIPLAEATGQILPIGNWALGRACSEAAEWAGDLTLSVNVSPLQFHAPDFVSAVETVLDRTGFSPERLELEITETVLMRDDPQAVRQLQALIALGVRIALDDFGTGYSALAYLNRFPHHRIKLDRSFVQDMERPSTAALIRAIIRLARAGGVAVTAEGVESPKQLRTARAMGFSHAQGFATGPPVRMPKPGPRTQDPDPEPGRD
ncbi:MAG TPA: EAL domain-containing protein [Paracoccaceae bacterium]|nr:EAL domain-containing protein [Paracoccaceae bacterium]